jgi:hypothetical protein
MVAVLSPQPEHLDVSEPLHKSQPHLRLVDGDTRFGVPAQRSSTRRHSSSTYWRRRIVVAGLLVGLLWLTLGTTQLVSAQGTDVHFAAAPTMVESAASDTLVGGRVVLVQPGDTLWSIARGLQPTGDVRPLIDRIAELNGGHSLIAGQTLMLP